MSIEDDTLFSGAKVRQIYSPGVYVASVTFYDGQKWYPREMTEENHWFKRNATFRVNKEDGAFYIDTVEHKPLQGLCFSILVRRRWQEIPWEELGYRIPIDAIDYRISEGFPVNNGMMLVAFHESGAMPQDENVRELRINFW